MIDPQAAASPSSRLERLGHGVVRAIYRHPFRALGALALLSALILAGVGQRMGWKAGPVPADNREEVWFSPDDPVLTTHRAFQEQYGNDETLLIAIDDPQTVFSASTLDLIADVASRVAALKVELPPPLGSEGRPTLSQPVKGVTCLATVRFVGNNDEGELVVERMYWGPLPGGEAGDAEAARIHKRVELSPAHRANLVSADGRTTLLTIQLEPFGGKHAQRAAIYEAIRAELAAAFEQADRAPDDWRWGGVGTINMALNELSRRDTGRFFLLSGAVMLLCLWLFLRRFLAVVVAVFSVQLAILLTMCLYVACGFKLNLVVSVLPTLVLAIGLTDCIYFVTTYYREREALEPTLGKEQTIVSILGFCFVPSFFNSLTASIGFLAFSASKLEVLRWFGVFAGVGILLSFVTALVFCTLAFRVFDLRPPASTGVPFTSFLHDLANFVERRHGRILIGSAVMAAVCAGGVALLRVDNATIDYFRPDHPVRQAAESIERDFGPFIPLDVVIDTGERDGAYRPDVLRGLDALERDRIANDPRLGGSVSLAAVVRQVNFGFWGEHAIPDEQNQVAQMMLFYDPMDPDEPLHLVDMPDFRILRASFRMTNASAREAGAAIEGLKDAGERLLPAGVELHPTGRIMLYVQQVRYILEGQIVSLSLTIVLVFLVIGGIFRDWRYAVLSLPANLIPVFMTLAFMGYAGIRLDGAAVLVGSITIAIAVDDTIHFMFKFRHHLEQSGDLRQAVRETIESIGLAIVVTSLIIAIGFSVLLFAGFKSMATFGLLCSVTMLSALLGELLVTPAVLLWLGPRLLKRHLRAADPKLDDAPEAAAPPKPQPPQTDSPGTAPSQANT